MKRLFALAALLIPITAGCTLSINGGSDPRSLGLPHCRAATATGRDESRSGLLLMAQSVRTATLLPCIKTLPIGWTFTRLDVTNQRARFWLDSDRAGHNAIRATLDSRCDVGNTPAAKSTRPDVREYDQISTATSGYSADRYFVFSGGCVTYHFNLRGAGSKAEMSSITAALDFVTRADLARSVRRYSHDRLDLDPTPSRSHP
jgi:hypothetical protein